MCVAATTALMIAGTAMSIGGSAMSMIQQRNAAEYNAEVAENQAAQARQVGKINEGLTRDEMRRQMARQRAHLAKSGVSLSSGSALDLGQDAGEQAFLQVQSVKSGAESRARAFDADAALSKAEGRAAMMRGAFNIGGTLLNAGSAFSRMSKTPDSAPGRQKGRP